jgi:hypothetical protein
MRLRKPMNSAGTGTSTMKYERVNEKMIDTSASSVISASIWMPWPFAVQQRSPVAIVRRV